MKELKKVSEHKFDKLVGIIWSIIDDGLKPDEIKTKLCQMSYKLSPELFSKCMLEAKKHVAEWEFKYLVSDICGIIEDADEDDEMGIHINEIKDILSSWGYNLSPELFSKCMLEVKKRVCYDSNELFFWPDRSYKNKSDWSG